MLVNAGDRAGPSIVWVRLRSAPAGDPETAMKRFAALCFALGALVTAQGAAAADLSLAPLYKSAPAAATPAYDWSGFYLGVNGGGGWGNSNMERHPPAHSARGGQAGGTAGYNMQFGKAVVGVEGDFDWSGLNGSSAARGVSGRVQHQRDLAVDGTRTLRLFVRPRHAVRHRRSRRWRHPRRYRRFWRQQRQSRLDARGRRGSGSARQLDRQGGIPSRRSRQFQLHRVHHRGAR